MLKDNQSKHEIDTSITYTREFMKSNEKKKRSYKRFFVSIGTIVVGAGLATGLTIGIKKEKNGR